MDNKKKKSGIQIFFDCAQLIIALFIPLAIIAYTVMQNNTEISIAQENRKQDLKIADERHEQEIILSTDEQEEAALVRYFDSLGKLLEKDMKLMNRTSIARFKTLTALAQLKSKRKGYLIRALIENKLITMNPGENLIIDLSLADLTGLDLSTNMLVKKEITCANFNQTTLINASFRGVTLTAIFLSLIIFGYFIKNRQARSKLVFDLPMPMSYYYIGSVWPVSNIYCTWWIWIEYSLNSIGLFLMAWISIERYILIFYPHAISQLSWKKWVLHFLPISFCLSWAPIFFFVIVVISPLCINVWDFTLLYCGNPCYYTVNILVQFDFIFDIVFPITIIMVANMILVIRVTYQKISRRQAINWRSHRKMVLQLWIVSSFYLAFWLPSTITLLIQMTALPSFMIDQLEAMLFLIDLIPLFLPMVCLSTLPDLTKKLIGIVSIRRNVIGAVTFKRDMGQTATIAIVPH
ncbi:unnamed protein product [Adineta steineri]|uniref:G-protein coupled receptors family 1 profile domain-containing protein n=1 Tax=Adineta steineri TaxID=433720 RepID=A0A815HHQ4_9BILA|nr:unnamed protein product [Adineta steineri]